MALDLLMEKGEPGETYNIGGGTEITNLELTRRILELAGKTYDLIQNVKDRPGHDRRYSLDTTKLKRLGWEPQKTFGEGLASTVDWYRVHNDWWQPIKSKSVEYRQFHQKLYGSEPESS